MASLGDRVRHLTDTDLGFAPARPSGRSLNIEDEQVEELSDKTQFDGEDIKTWLRAINRKKQAIFYGPPGTGKTFVAQEIADSITAAGDGMNDLVQFHQSYEYEDFMQGIRPESDDDGNLSYPVKPGRFLTFCRDAADRDGPCVLIIDEINRADLSSVFGELMYLLEYREDSIQLSQDDADAEPFSIPENVYIFGTMNTADRSIALVDFAIRRRFAFIPVRPNFDVLRNHYADDPDIDVSDLVQVLTEINNEIEEEDFHLGITYFLNVDLKAELANIWQMEIVPYLEEYFVDERERVEDYRWDEVRDRIDLEP